MCWNCLQKISITNDLLQHAMSSCYAESNTNLCLLAKSMAHLLPCYSMSIAALTEPHDDTVQISGILHQSSEQILAKPQGNLAQTKTAAIQ